MLTKNRNDAPLDPEGIPDLPLSTVHDLMPECWTRAEQNVIFLLNRNRTEIFAAILELNQNKTEKKYDGNWLGKRFSTF